MRIEENNINGGSYRIYCKKNIKKSIFYKEKANLLEIKKFISRVKENKKRCLTFIKKCNAKGEKILLYGASTKGNVILQYCNINKNYLSRIVEVNSFKYNKYTPGSKIKIVSEKIIKKNKPDYLLVLPWHFKEHIVKKEKKLLDNGVKFIFPLPEIEIV